MPIFRYDGFDQQGRPARGEIAAQTSAKAGESLVSRNIKPLSIRQIRSVKTFSFDLPPGQKDLTVFTRDFAAMLSAGVPISQCTDILARQADKKSMTRIISQVSADIMGGMPLAEALRKFPATFDTLYCNMIAAGEASGKLDETLTQLARHLEKASATKHRIAAAMAYPAAVACITIAATALMFGLVVPKFASMFLELGGALPLPTRIVMDISTGSRTWFLPGFLAVLVLIFLTDKWRKSSGGALPFEKILLAIPATGKLRQKSAVARFARTLATLLASGVGILQALSIAATASGNAVLNKGILVALEHIAGGQSIAGPLEESGFFPPMVVHMVAVGEKTGDLSGMFHRIAAIYDEEVETAVRTFTSMLEPLLLVLMAVIIGTILIAMYLPMFELMSTIQ